MIFRKSTRNYIMMKSTVYIALKEILFVFIDYIVIKR